ncbi:MAG: hypothetical protein LBR39_08555, partial [Coriobacteriales bacterium]|nr:hypothetical protein [Coriobacteriales bacterium]
MRILGLFALNFRLALRYLLVLLLACAVLLGLVLLSLPKALFSKGDVPAVSIAFVYGDGTRSDTMMRNLSAEVDGIDVLDEFYVCTAEEAEELLAAGQVDAIIEMPEDTLDALVYGGHATVTVKASDPFMGAVVFSVVERAVDALDEIQNYALIYAGVAAEHFADEEQLWRAVNDFDFQLVSVAAGRLAAVDLQSEVSPYYAQLLTMLSFAVGAVAAL